MKYRRRGLWIGVGVHLGVHLGEAVVFVVDVVNIGIPTRWAWLVWINEPPKVAAQLQSARRDDS